MLGCSPNEMTNEKVDVNIKEKRIYNNEIMEEVATNLQDKTLGILIKKRKA